MKVRSLAALVLAFAAWGLCSMPKAAAQDAAAGTPPSLYKQLGGYARSIPYVVHPLRSIRSSIAVRRAA
jgi:hypothetical protein